MESANQLGKPPLNINFTRSEIISRKGNKAMPSPNESSKKKSIWINGNRYETTDTIGQGGQGVAYRAVDSSGGASSPSRSYQQPSNLLQEVLKGLSRKHNGAKNGIPRELNINLPRFL